MANTEMCKKVYDYILEHPDEHNQDFWQDGEDDACGTTRCIAGWAAYFDGWRNNSINTSWSKGGEWGRPEEIGRDALGLTDEQATALFYNYDNDIALKQLGVHAGVEKQADVDFLRGVKSGNVDAEDAEYTDDGFSYHEAVEYPNNWERKSEAYREGYLSAYPLPEGVTDEPG